MTANPQPVSRALATQLSTFAANWSTVDPISTHTDYRRAVTALAWIRRVRLDIQASFKEMKAAANAARASILGQEKKWVGKTTPLEEALTDRIVAYDRHRAAVAKDAARAALKVPAGTSLLAYSDVSTPTEGYHTRQRRVVVVEDKGALIRAVADGLIAAEALTVNASYLRRTAEAQGELAHIPGVRIDLAYTIVTHDE